MFLTSLYILLNLDTEVSSFDRERVLRSLRERLKNSFGQSITLRTDTDSAIAVAFLEDSLERAHNRAEAVLSRLEEAGEARVLSVQTQIFAWHDGEFRELEHERTYDDMQEAEQSSMTMPMRQTKGRSRTKDSHGARRMNFGEDFDELLEETSDEMLGSMAKRQNRRNLRIPVRK
jgi:hypothetical protein